MKKSLILAIIILLWAVTSYADWNVTVNWTPSPNAASEVLLVDTTQKSCPQAGTCTFTVQDLTNQAVVIRSSNDQGAFIDYAAGNLTETQLPSPASSSIIVITIIP